MKKFNCLLFTVYCLLFSLSSVRAQNFEGSYTMHIESSKTNKPGNAGMDMNITVKGDKSSLEMVTAENAGKFKTIFDKKEQTMTILVEKEGANKMAMLRKMPDESELADKEAKDVKITVTDETKTIEGYKCKKVIAESDESITDMWMTEDIGLTYADMFGMIHRGRGPASGMTTQMKNYKDIKGVPLEMTIKNKKNPNEITVITVKNIKVGNVDDKVFDTSGYQVMDMRNAGER